jgi:hypothetical protein
VAQSVAGLVALPLSVKEDDVLVPGSRAPALCLRCATDLPPVAREITNIRASTASSRKVVTIPG